MPVIGIGVDIADVARIRMAVERSGEPFIRRVCTPAEHRRCRARRDPAPCLASRFAAKEALAKALQIGIARMGMTNAEVCNRDNGAPYFRLHGKLAEWAASQPGLNIQVSLSDGPGYAVAMVVVEAPEGITIPERL